MSRKIPSAGTRSASRRQFLMTAGLSAAVAAGLPAAQAAPAAPRKKPSPKPFKLGVASYTFRSFNLDQTLAMTKRVGLDYICFKDMHLPLQAKPDQIAAAVAKTKEAGLVLYGCGVVYMAKEPEVNQAFDYAKAAGMKVIVGAPTVAMLPLVDKKVKEYGITVAIHNHGPGDKIFPTPESIYTKVKDLDPRIGLCIDIGHTVRIGADLLESTRKYADRLFDVHIKDVTAADPKGQGTEVGRGIIDIPGFLQTLIDIKFSGVVSFEYEENAKDPLPGLAESVGYTKGVLAML